MDTVERATVEAVEAHEVLMWRRCVEAVIAAPDDPLGIIFDDAGPFPMTALSSIDSEDFNRVVGLGLGSPADRGDIDRILAFYRDHGKSRFRVEVAPVARPAEVPQWLEEAGLHRVPVSVTKLWEYLTDTTPAIEDPGDTDIRRLDVSDADAVGRLTAIAYGAFDSSDLLQPWFSATVGRPGFIYYGAFENDRLVASGATFVEGDLAWFGFAVTHPRFRSRTIQQSLTARRLRDTREMGGRIVHGEIRTDRIKSPRALVFKEVYEKWSWSTVPSDQIR
jgi:hypothetical protein